jgi:GTP1/Obg family GTP-binding protein
LVKTAGSTGNALSQEMVEIGELRQVLPATLLVDDAMPSSNTNLNTDVTTPGSGKSSVLNAIAGLDMVEVAYGPSTQKVTVAHVALEGEKGQPSRVLDLVDTP